MTAKLSDATLWQTTLASLIRSGLFDRAEVVDSRGLYAVVGVYATDGSHSAAIAKYADVRRAEDALDVVYRLAGSSRVAECEPVLA